MKKTQVINIAFLVIIIASLTTNFWLYRELKNTFIALYQTSLNPLGLNKYRNQKIEIRENIPTVVFLGDSRAYYWQFPQNENFQFINRGISGQTSAQILGRFPHHILPLKPDIVVLQLGANDLRMLPSSNETRKDIVSNCQQNIFQIIQQARELGSTIIVTTIFPLSADNIPLKYRPFWPNLQDIEQSINEVNQYLKTLDNQVILFDAYTLLEKNDPQKTKYYKDLLHLNRRGYQLLNQELEKILIRINTKSKI